MYATSLLECVQHHFYNELAPGFRARAKHLAPPYLERSNGAIAHDLSVRAQAGSEAAATLDESDLSGMESLSGDAKRRSSKAKDYMHKL